MKGLHIFVGNERPIYPFSRPTKDWDKLEAQGEKEVFVSVPSYKIYNVNLKVVDEAEVDESEAMEEDSQWLSWEHVTLVSNLASLAKTYSFGRAGPMSLVGSVAAAASGISKPAKNEVEKYDEAPRMKSDTYSTYYNDKATLLDDIRPQVHQFSDVHPVDNFFSINGIRFLGSSEGIQIEYIAVFLAVLFPGALVAFNHELLEMIPRVATLRIYCAGIWHNAAFCVVCALTLFLLPLILYPLYSHGENLMVLDVSAESPLYNYLSPGDLITKLDGKHIRTSKEWMETAYLLDKQLFQTKDKYISNKGYCVPNLVIAESKNVEIVDNEFKCPDELTLFTTISCVDSNTIHDGSSNGTDHKLTRENVYCFPAKGVLGEKKCGDGWDNIMKNNSNCLCVEDESCVTPVHPPGVAWVEITFSRPCSNYNSSGLEENRCDSLAEWSKAPDLGSGPKGRGFKSHSCQNLFFSIL
nr:membrane-bound transcription factor site-2 protease homolog isoform X3 [Tanacetum cinerariifolium]